jgi:hypothetical protein
MFVVPPIIQFIEYCKKALVAEDTEQFAHLTVAQLANAVHIGFQSPHLFHEIRKRLAAGGLSAEDRLMLLKLLAFEEEKDDAKE